MEAGGVDQFLEWQDWMVERGYESRGYRIGSFFKRLPGGNVFVQRSISSADNWDAADWVVVAYTPEQFATRLRMPGFPTPMAAHVYAEVEGWLT